MKEQRREGGREGGKEGYSNTGILVNILVLGEKILSWVLKLYHLTTVPIERSI